MRIKWLNYRVYLVYLDVFCWLMRDEGKNEREVIARTTWMVMDYRTGVHSCNQFDPVVTWRNVIVHEFQSQSSCLWQVENPFVVWMTFLMKILIRFRALFNEMKIFIFTIIGTQRIIVAHFTRWIFRSVHAFDFHAMMSIILISCVFQNWQFIFQKLHRQKKKCLLW